MESGEYARDELAFVLHSTKVDPHESGNGKTRDSSDREHAEASRTLFCGSRCARGDCASAPRTSSCQKQSSSTNPHIASQYPLSAACSASAEARRSFLPVVRTPVFATETQRTQRARFDSTTGYADRFC